MDVLYCHCYLASRAFIFDLSHFAKQLTNRPRYKTFLITLIIWLLHVYLGYQHIRILCLFCVLVSIHSVSLTTSCLAIDKHSRVETRHYLMNKVVYISLVINGILCCVVIKDLVESKVFGIVVAVICDSIKIIIKRALLT